MGAEKGKKQRSGEMEEENNGVEVIDGELLISIEKLQAIQEDLEKVILLSFIVFILQFCCAVQIFLTPVFKLECFREIPNLLFFLIYSWIFKGLRIFIYCASIIVRLLVEKAKRMQMTKTVEFITGDP